MQATRKLIPLSLVLGMGAIGSAVAQDATCAEPATPAIVDGTSATKEALIANIHLVKAFLQDSDQYQQCLGNAYVAQKAQADKNKVTLDPSIKTAMLAKVDANQKLKEQVGANINNAIRAFKKANPGN